MAMEPTARRRESLSMVNPARHRSLYNVARSDLDRGAEHESDAIGGELRRVRGRHDGFSRVYWRFAMRPEALT